MRTLGCGTLAVILMAVFGLAPAARGGDDTDDPLPPRERAVSGHGVFNKLFDAISPPAKKPVPKKPGSKTAGAPKVTIINATPDPRIGADTAFFRRVAVCDQLREIAAARNDADLEHQADELNQRAWDVYSQAMSRKPAADSDASEGKKEPAKKDGRVAKDKGRKFGRPARGE